MTKRCRHGQWWPHRRRCWVVVACWPLRVPVPGRLPRNRKRPLQPKYVAPSMVSNVGFVPRRSGVGRSPERGADGSDLSVLGKGKCVFRIGPEIADRVLDLSMTKRDLDGMKIAGCPVNDRCLRSAKGVRAIFTSHQTNPVTHSSTSWAYWRVLRCPSGSTRLGKT